LASSRTFPGPVVGGQQAQGLVRDAVRLLVQLGSALVRKWKAR
jgi:hypothetical protein